MKRRTIAKVNADPEAEKFLSYYEIEDNKDDPEKSKGYHDLKDLISGYFASGKISIKEGEEFILVQHLKNNSDTLEYQEISGSAKLEMDKYKGEVQKQYALIGHLTGKGFDVISKMKSTDLSTAEALANLFLLL